jgi:hypothetical protein
MDHGGFDLVSDGIEAGDSVDGIGVSVEWKSSLNGGFPDRQSRPCVLRLQSHFAQCIELRGVRQALSQVRVKADGELHLAGSLKKPESPDGHQGLEGFAPFLVETLGRSKVDRLPKFIPGELPIEGDRLVGGPLIKPLRVLRNAGGFGCAPLPVGRARDGDRGGRNVGGLGKVACSCSRIVAETQRDPPGMELRLDSLRGRFRSVPTGHLVGGFGVPLVEERASDQAALGPPGVPVGEQVRIAGSLRHHLGGFGELAFAPQIERPREDVGRVGAQMRRHGSEGLLGLLAALERAHPRLDESGVFLTGPRGGAQRGAPILLEKEALHAEPVIHLSKNTRELVQKPTFELRAEAVLSPGATSHFLSLLAGALVPEREGERDSSGAAHGSTVGEERSDSRRRTPYRQQRLLGAPPHRGGDGPLAVITLERDDLIETGRNPAADREPPRGRRGGGLLEPRLQDLGLGNIARPIRREDARKIVLVARRADGEDRIGDMPEGLGIGVDRDDGAVAPVRALRRGTGVGAGWRDREG